MSLKSGVIFVVSFLLAAGAGGQSHVRVSPRKTLVVCIAPGLFSEVNIRDAQAAVQTWGNAVSRRMDLGYEVEVVVPNDRPSTIEAIKSGKVELISLTGLDYLAMKDEVDLEPAVVGIWGEDRKVAEEYVLLVRRDSGLEELSHLQGRRLIIGTADRGETAAMWLDVLLLREGLPAGQDFLRARAAEKASQALLPVFFGQVDACVVPHRALQTMGELNPQVMRELRTLARSPEFLVGFMCFRGGSDAGRREKLMDVVFKIHAEVEGRQLLTIFRSDRVDRFQPVYLESLADLKEEYESLKASLANPHEEGK